MTENELKYGEKQNDVIAQEFAFSKIMGAGFCFGNIKKYLTRYISDSEKSKNPKDLGKAKDYLNRLHQKDIINDEDLSIITEFIESNNITDALYNLEITKKYFADLYFERK